jgi:hypothetical protein
MSGGDGMDFYTQVLATSGTWMPVILSYHTRHEMSPLPKILALVKHTWCLKTPGDTARSPAFPQVRERGGTS